MQIDFLKSGSRPMIHSHNDVRFLIFQYIFNDTGRQMIYFFSHHIFHHGRTE